MTAAQRRPDAFTINHAAPRIDARKLQVTANLRAGSAKGVETRRAVILASRHGGVYARAKATEGCYFCEQGDLARVAALGKGD